MKYLLLFLAFSAFTANAIIIRHDTLPAQYQVSNTKYPSVINLNYLTGTLIDEQWILTAAHGTPYMPSQQKLNIAGNEYQVDYIIVHPQYNQNNLSHDIALLKLNRKVTGIKSTVVYQRNDEESQHVWFVGQGDTGNGKLGVTGPSEVLNHAENIIDSVEPLWITFDFDSPENQALLLEGISGPGDSGGPAFITTPSGLKVAGISSHQRNNAEGEGFYGVEEYYTRTSAHQTWLADTMKLSVNELKQHALPRTAYVTVEVSPDEVKALLGSYFLANDDEFIIATCANGICYQWAGNDRKTTLLKANNNQWFAPDIHRAFTVKKNAAGQITHLHMDDFHGQRILERRVLLKESKQVTTLKSKIKTRDRELLHHVEPIWPTKALAAQIQGSVTMSFDIDIKGKVNNIVVTEATPKGTFDQAAITALAQWRYAPLTAPLSNVLTRFDFTP